MAAWPRLHCAAEGISRGHGAESSLSLLTRPRASRQMTAPFVHSNGNTAHEVNEAMGRFDQTMAGFLCYLLKPVLNQNIMQLSKTKSRGLLSLNSTETVQNILC